MASTSQESQEHGKACGSSKLKITILASEWGSSMGGLSAINRQLAIQLAKFPSVEITFFVPKCSVEEKKAAFIHNVHILEANPRLGYEELDWLSFPPLDMQVDIIIGHGVKLGKQAQIIREVYKCKWVQCVHTDPEELGTFKGVEIKLCEISDFVVGVGPKINDTVRTCLCWCEKHHSTFDLTPGVFDEFMNINHRTEDGKHRSVLVFGHGDAMDFELKGLNIVARAVASLPDTHLFFGASDGNHEEVAQRFLDCDVPANHLKFRSYDKSQESLKRLFWEVDLVLMPSRTEGFGLTGLEALSAGLPVLVSKNSGFGRALSKVKFGSAFVIDSEDPKMWAAAIKTIWEKNRQNRLEEAKDLRTSYEKKYNWTEQSKALLVKMINLVRGEVTGPVLIDGSKGTRQSSKMDSTGTSHCPPTLASKAQEGEVIGPVLTDGSKGTRQSLKMDSTETSHWPPTLPSKGAPQSSSCLEIVHQTKPSLSIADGQGLTEAVAGCEAQFKVTIKDVDGRQCYSERDRVTVEIQDEPRRAHKTEVEINDNNNGQYQIRFCPRDQGRYSVIIKINGEHVHGSPYNLQVKAAGMVVCSGNLSVRGGNSGEYSPSPSASRSFSPEQRACSLVVSGKSFKYQFVSCFGKEGPSVGMFNSPYGVAVNDVDEIAVTDSLNHRVQLFDSSGKFLRSFGHNGANQGEFRNPRGICFDKNGKIFVADMNNGRIQIFSREGRYMGGFGEIGNGDNQLTCPLGLSLDAKGNVVVADNGNKLIKIFTPDGKFVRKIGEPGSFSCPVHCVQCDEYFIVSDRDEHCIKVFSGEGKFQFKFGQKGRGDGEFIFPRCLSVTKSKQLIVCDFNNHRLQCFELNGQFVGKFGTQGTNVGQFACPTSAAFLSTGRIVVSEYFNHRIQIWK